jgi:hypothetical protein
MKSESSPTGAVQTPLTVPAAAAPGAPATNAAEAAARLGSLQKTDWTSRLLAGDETARAEFEQLTGLIANEDPVDGVAAGLPADRSVREMAEAVPFLREAGLSDDVIRQVFTDQEVTQKEFDLATQWKAQRFRDQEWVKRFLSGEPDAGRQMMAANIILNSAIKEFR